jgi:uncharacterized protein (TIGR02246 family)
LLTAASFTALLVIVAPDPVAHAQAGDARKDVLDAEQRWARALEKSDLAALRDLYGDDLVYVHSGGNAESKDEYLRRVETGSLKYESVTLVDPKVRVFGDAAVVNGQFDVRVMSDGAPVNTRVVYIHVYARQGGKWRMVAHQTTRAPGQ